MLLELPDQMLQSDRNIAQRANHSLPCSMGPQGFMGPCINSRLGRPFETFDHPVIDSPIRLPHQAKAMLKLLDPAGPLMPLFNVQLQIWPGKV